jgi:hypothetical protein
MTTDAAAIARRFVHAIAAKDPETLSSVLHPEIEFRGLTPSRDWRATDPAGVAEIAFGSWFEPQDHIDEVLHLEIRQVLDRHHVLYRFRVHNDDGMYLVEQQGYFDAADGRISRMSLVCSGYRPLEATTEP